MANKVKNHSDEVMNLVKKLSTDLHAQFIATKMSIIDLSTKTGLSTNSLKTILRGETANIASYIAVAIALGLTVLASDPVANTSVEDKEVTGKFQKTKV